MLPGVWLLCSGHTTGALLGSIWSEGVVAQGCAFEEALAWLDTAAKDAQERQAQAAELEFGNELLALSIAASYPELDDMEQVTIAAPRHPMHMRSLCGTIAAQANCVLKSMERVRRTSLSHHISLQLTTSASPHHCNHAGLQEAELLQRAWLAVEGWQSSARLAEGVDAAAEGTQALSETSAEVLQAAASLGKSGDGAWPILKWLEVRAPPELDICRSLCSGGHLTCWLVQISEVSRFKRSSTHALQEQSRGQQEHVEG